MTDEDISQWVERESRKRTERVKQMCREQGRPDLADELDSKMKEIRTGVDSARRIWHSITKPQRRALQAAATAPLDRPAVPAGQYRGNRLTTLRCLVERDLLAPDGTAFDPEAKFAITEHGRFVLSHGPTPGDPRYG